MRVAILGLFAGATLTVAAWATLNSVKVRALEAEVEVLELRLGACEARTINLEEDRKSDAIIDNPDFVPPARWLLPETRPAGGGK